jgi:hypothetical protein
MGNKSVMTRIKIGIRISYMELLVLIMHTLR